MGWADGMLTPPDFDADIQLYFSVGDNVEESLTDFKLNSLEYEFDFEKALGGIDLGHHPQNISVDLEHVLVLSTGRCGTNSLFRLFRDSHYAPHHLYLWTPDGGLIREMMCRLIGGNFDDQTAVDVFLQCRSAEWLSAINEGKPVISVNHFDTIFAPVWAKIHKKSKFIYLRRSPTKVVQSYYKKSLLSAHSLCPVHYEFPYKWKFIPCNVISLLYWLVSFTEDFARNFGRIMGDRFIEISSDKLFSQDEKEIDRLLEFVNAGIDSKFAKEHFGVPYNARKENTCH